MLFTFQPDPPAQTARTPISARMAQISQVQELFHEAAQQVGLGGAGVCDGTTKGLCTKGCQTWKHYSVLF